MGTMTITQAQKTYRVIQSNNGVRLEFEAADGTFDEVFRHWPDEASPEPQNTAPEIIDNDFSLDLRKEQ